MRATDGRGGSRGALVSCAMAAIAFAAYVALGAAVSGRPPTAFDTLARGESGRFVDVALFFTHAGLFGPYAVLCLLALGLGLVRRAWLGAALFEIGLMIAIWRVSDAFKNHFHRARPTWWYRILEPSYAYASGHAALSLTFYGFAAFAIVRSTLPLGAKRIVVFVCGIMIVGIGWSRLALGAHFPTDLIGGYLLALSGLGVAAPLYDALLRRKSHPYPLSKSL